MKRLFETTVAAGLRMVAVIGMTAIFSRSLPLETFGSLALGLFAGQLIAIIVDGGINNKILRFAGTDSDLEINDRLTKSTAIRIITMMPIMIIIFVVTAILEDLKTAQTLTLGAFSSTLGSVGETYFMSLRATGRSTLELKQTALLASLMLSIPLLAFWHPNFAGTLALAPRLASLISLTKHSFSDIIYSIKNNHTIAAVRDYYTHIRHYSLDSIASNLATQLDAILIASLLGKQSYATYQPSSKLFLGALSAAPIVAGISVPSAAKMESKSRSSLAFLIYSFGLSGVFFGIILFPMLAWGVSHLFSKEYQLSLESAILLSVIVLLRFFAAGAGSFLTLKGHQKTRAWTNFFSMAIIIPTTLMAEPSIEGILKNILGYQVLLAVIYSTYAIKLRKRDGSTKINMPQ